MANETWTPVPPTAETWTAATATVPTPVPPDPPPPTDPETPIPVNTVPPVLGGSPNPGLVLTVSTGTWTNSPTSYAYAWFLDGVFTGVTAASYTVPAGSHGKVILARVTATNAGGSATADISTTGVQPAPVSTSPPTITGVFDIFQTLASTNGTWSNDPTSFTRQWLLDDVAITGATGTTYQPRASDRNGVLSVAVTATNAGGSTTATSAIISPRLRYAPVVIFS